MQEVGFLDAVLPFSRQKLDLPLRHNLRMCRDVVSQLAAALAAALLLAIPAAALQGPAGAQDLFSEPDVDKRPQLQRGCVLLDAAGGSPCFAAGASACAGARAGWAGRLWEGTSQAPHRTQLRDARPFSLLAGAAAHATFLPGQHTRGGWHQLWVSTSDAYSDEQQALALGFAEGWLTGEPPTAHLHCSQ